MELVITLVDVQKELILVVVHGKRSFSVINWLAFSATTLLEHDMFYKFYVSLSTRI